MAEKIEGYRTLSDAEVAKVNKVKALEKEALAFAKSLRNLSEDVVADQRWVSIGTTHLEQGFMALVRSITRPD